MPTPPQFSVVVPAYNEVRSIAGTVQKIQAYFQAKGASYEIIVAADGNDGTRELVAEMAATDPRVSVIGSAERGGKGRGVRNGVAKATGQVIGFIDADYKTPIEELDKLLPFLEQGCEMVIGSRKVGESRIEKHQALYRRVGSWGFAVVRNMIVGLGDVRDTQCGFKFMQRHAAKTIFARQTIDGYMFDVEILFLARRAGYRIKEVGVRWQDDGDSRSNLVGGTWKHVRDLLRVRFARRPAQPTAPAGAVLPGQKSAAA